MAGGTMARTMRDRRKTSTYYMITGAFAVVLIVAAVFFFRSPSEQSVDAVQETSVGTTETNVNLPTQNEVTETPKEEVENEDSTPVQNEKNESIPDEVPKKDGVEDQIDELDNPEPEPEKKLDGKTDEETKLTDQKPDEEKTKTEEVHDETKEDIEEKIEEDNKEDIADLSPQETIQHESPVQEEKKEETVLADELPANKTELELTVENKEITNNWTSQANASKEEKQQQQEDVQSNAPAEAENQPEAVEDTQKSTEQKTAIDQVSYDWKLCNFKNAADYIPCLDNQKAIKQLKSRKHYEHRERHCPSGDDIKRCLVPLPQGYQAHVNWPQSRKQVWYNNVPHPGLVSYKKDQNWVKKKDDLLIFPGGGTQFKQGAERYIEFIELSVPQIAWGKHTRTVLDVGCGVASFGGFLFDKNVLTMSFAPKDEHEAQVQLALERGIPAILAVMGTQRLVYPSNSYDVAHCARCRVPWHKDDGKLLLELNRLIRPGGYFVWSATPVYKSEQEDREIWRDTKAMMDAMCWKMLIRKIDPHTGVGIAVFQKPTSNNCYQKRRKDYPPMCEASDNPDAAWYIPMQSCIHKIPVDGARGSSWPAEWPRRVNATPDWVGTIPKGLFGKPAVEEFQADTEHWSHVVERSYARGLEIDWTVIRNVMDMKAGYGGFAAALTGYPVWVLNVVPITEPDTLPIIFERGLIGQYHDWCESFSTYPRTYDLLHADHLFSRLKQSCGMVNTVLEMDRILRPGGWGIFRDTTTILGEIEPLLKSLHWEIRVSYKQDQEQLIAAQKTYWRPSTT